MLLRASGIRRLVLAALALGASLAACAAAARESLQDLVGSYPIEYSGISRYQYCPETGVTSFEVTSANAERIGLRINGGPSAEAPWDAANLTMEMRSDGAGETAGLSATFKFRFTRSPGRVRVDGEAKWNFSDCLATFHGEREVAYEQPELPTSLPRAGLACEYTPGRASPEVDCRAAVTGARPGASIDYRWRFDGRGRDASGATFYESDPKPGNHRVSVVASVDGAPTPPVEVEVRVPAPRGQERATVDQFGRLIFPAGRMGPIVGGTAFAAALALGLLLGARIGKGPPVRKSRPVAQPEERSEQESDTPWIRATVTLSPSVRTKADTAIWGDGVDLMFAGYTLEKAPGWRVVAGSETFEFETIGGSWKRVREFRHFDPSWLAHEPQAAFRRAVVFADWSDQDGQLTVKVRVSATLAREGVPPQPCTSPDEPSATLTVDVIGATPRLVLKADPLAYADGACKVAVQPVLVLFRAPYAGGLTLLKESIELQGGGGHGLGAYFDPSIETFVGDDHPEYRAQFLMLRCKFLFKDDEPFAALSGGRCRIAYRVKPTGHGPSEIVRDGGFDYMPAEHYQACAKRLTNAYAVEAADVTLEPSHLLLGCEGGFPAYLPRAGAASGEYRLKLSAGVGCGAGPVPGSQIRNERDSGQGGSPLRVEGWFLRIRYERSTQPLLRAWEPNDHLRSFDFDVSDVDEEGNVIFAPSDMTTDEGKVIDYDHWARHYNASEAFLCGQCVWLEITLFTQDTVRAERKIPVGPCHKLYIFGDGQGIVGHTSVGLIDTEGQEVRAGVHPDLWIEGYDASAGQYVGIGSGATLSGGGALLLAKLFGVTLAGPAGIAVVASTAIVGAAAGMFKGSRGIGKLKDDHVHEFDVCRGWDVTAEQHAALLTALKALKKHSDTNALIYDLDEQHAQDVPGTGHVGNCCTAAEHVCARGGIPLYGGYPHALRRPGNVVAALRQMSRAVENPAYKASGYEHPWRYGPELASPPKLNFGLLGRYSAPPPKW